MTPQELADQLEDTAARIGEIAQLEDEPGVLSRSYAPGKWTGVELLSHLAETDAMYLTRFFRVIAEPGIVIQTFDQDKWVVELEAASRPPHLSSLLIIASRAMFAHCLRTFSAEKLSRKTMHPERGELTALRMAEMMAWHGAHHLEQLEAIRDGRGWTPKAT